MPTQNTSESQRDAGVKPMMEKKDDELLIRMQPTPNPQALKFILNQSVKNVGKATYNSKDETYGNVLAFSLMEVEGSKQVHMFENSITVTFVGDMDPYDRVDDVIAVIKSRFVIHDPSFTVESDKITARKDLSPEVQKIEEILDRTIRPGLQADGGDVEIVKLEGLRLEIRYEGACGTCPSATMGTLQAIEGILQNEYDPELQIVLDQEMYY